MLKTKDQVFDTFKQWKVLNENQTDKRIKRLRTNNGLEFCSEEFSEFCRKHGIARHRTTVGTPQQNGLAECDTQGLTTVTKLAFRIITIAL